jgi:hypothetical protein
MDEVRTPRKKNSVVKVGLFYLNFQLRIFSYD